MRIVHVSYTPCAGAIEALSSAIRDYTEHDSRWIGNGGVVNNLRFPRDAMWSETEQHGLLATADVIVMHNGGGKSCLSDTSDPIADFLGGDPGKKVVAYFHGHPDQMPDARRMEDDGIPVFVPAQYQSVLWPTATPVRSVIRFDRSDWPVAETLGDKSVMIGYAPTFRDPKTPPEPDTPGWYYQKGYDLTVAALEAVREASDKVVFALVEGLEYDLAIRAKAHCSVLIDEVVTGGYHRNTLEGLALGIPTIVNMSPEVHGVMSRAAGANNVPVIHSTADGLVDRLMWVVGMDEAERAAIGRSGHDWMARYWHPRDIARRFCAALKDAPTYAEVKA